MTQPVLTADCEGCRKPAEPPLSIVWIDLWEALDARENFRPGGDSQHPFNDATVAHWHVHHVACRDKYERSGGPIYDLDLSVLVQRDRLAEHTEHLRSKNWFAHTDWLALVAYAEESGRLASYFERAA